MSTGPIGTVPVSGGLVASGPVPSRLFRTGHLHPVKRTGLDGRSQREQGGGTNCAGNCDRRLHSRQ